MQSLYDRTQVRPMWQELDDIGVKPLTTGDEVDRAMAEKEGTALIFVNSVCGCSAGTARPGLAMALQNKTIPDRLYTVFAGVDRGATEQARSYMADVPPSSPSVALFKNGDLVFVMSRQYIEGRPEEDVAETLAEAFDKYCEAKGPSVPREKMLEAFGASEPKCSSELRRND